MTQRSYYQNISFEFQKLPRLKALSSADMYRHQMEINCSQQPFIRSFVKLLMRPAIVEGFHRFIRIVRMLQYLRWWRRTMFPRDWLFLEACWAHSPLVERHLSDI